MKTIRHAVTMIAASFLLFGIAHGHTQLSGSVPADAAVLDKAPGEIVLKFSEAVRLTAISIGNGDNANSLKIDVADAAEEFTVGLPKLVAGEYVVRWRALSEDTHVVTGEIRFSITG